MFQLTLVHNRHLDPFEDFPFHDRSLFRQVLVARGFRDVELLHRMWEELESDRKVQVSFTQSVLPFPLLFMTYDLLSRFSKS